MGMYSYPLSARVREHGAGVAEKRSADNKYADLKMDDLTLWDEEFDADDVRNLYNAY